jgi:4-hydroxybenzoate polyprenyltransferase
MTYSSEKKIDILSIPYIGIRTRVFKRLHSLFDVIAFSSLILAFTGGFGVYASCFIEDIPWSYASAVIMTLVSFSVYNLNRKTDEQEDKINHRERYSFTKKFEKILFYGALVSYAIALAISIFYGISAFFVACIPMLSGILYSEPILPVSWRYHRLKEIPVIKNVIVAVAWAVTLSLLPICMVKDTPDIGVLISAIFFFTYVFMASILPDIRDREGDFAVGITTLPVLIGIPRTNHVLIVIISTLGGLILLGGYLFSPHCVIIMLIIGIAYILFCILSMEGFIKTNIVCDFLADGGFIFFGLVTVLLTFLGGNI